VASRRSCAQQGTRSLQHTQRPRSLGAATRASGVTAGDDEGPEGKRQHLLQLGKSLSWFAWMQRLTKDMVEVGGRSFY